MVYREGQKRSLWQEFNLPSLGWLVIRKGNNMELLVDWLCHVKIRYFVVTPELIAFGVFKNEIQVAALDHDVREKANCLRRDSGNLSSKRVGWLTCRSQTQLPFPLGRPITCAPPSISLLPRGREAGCGSVWEGSWVIIPRKSWYICATLPPPDS